MYNSEGKLLIFENFRKDLRLPKFKTPEPEKKTAIITAPGQEHFLQFQTSNSVLFSTNASTGSVILSNQPWGGVSQRPVNEDGAKPTRKRSLLPSFLRKSDKPTEPPPSISIQEFFSSLKNSAEELKEVAERANGYETSIKNAMASGQTALVDRLKDGLVVARTEAQLIAAGLTKYVTEETVVDFAKKTTKGLILDWIEHFVRVIPPEVVARKLAADEKCLFDNYVILAYDPKGKATALTKKEEIAKKKDPILFGVLEGSRKLYFIGDWIDELCDLTLDQIAETLGKNTAELK